MKILQYQIPNFRSQILLPKPFFVYMRIKKLTVVAPPQFEKCHNYCLVIFTQDIRTNFKPLINIYCGGLMRQRSFQCNHTLQTKVFAVSTSIELMAATKMNRNAIENKIKFQF